MQAPRPGERPDAAWRRFIGGWHAPQQSPFLPRWAAAAATDEIHERLVAGPPA